MTECCVREDFVQHHGSGSNIALTGVNPLQRKLISLLVLEKTPLSGPTSSTLRIRGKRKLLIVDRLVDPGQVSAPGGVSAVEAS